MSHIPDHASHIPGPEYVAKMHSRMEASDWRPNFPGDVGHRPYNQAEGEVCYLCALLHHVEQLRAENDRLRRTVDELAEYKAMYLGLCK